MPAMAPSDFVASATQKGFIFSVKPGGALGVKPPPGGSLTEPMRRYIASMKTELLLLLTKVGKCPPTGNLSKPVISQKTLNTGSLTKTTPETEMVATGRLQKPLGNADAKAPELLQLEQVGAVSPHGLKHIETVSPLELAEVGRESPPGLEQNGTENRGELGQVGTKKEAEFGEVRSKKENEAEASEGSNLHSSELRQARFIGQLGQVGEESQLTTVLDWACSEARRDTLPELAEALPLPSGQACPADHAAAWLIAAESRSAGLRSHAEAFPDCALALEDLRCLAYNGLAR